MQALKRFAILQSKIISQGKAKEEEVSIRRRLRLKENGSRLSVVDGSG